MEFKELLRKAGLTKTELAKQLGLNKATITHWKHCPPQYATAYVELLIAYRKVT